MGSGASQPATPPVLYSFPMSPPCRAVLMTAEILKVNLKVENIDLPKGEQNSEKFIKINPDHTLPTLVDGSLTLWESRAIQQYLVDKYAPNHSLYPKDPVQRARVDRLLQYDLGHAAPTLIKYIRHRLLMKQDKDEEMEKNIDQVLEYLDNTLKGHKYVAGDQVSIADLSLVSAVNVLELLQWDYTRFPKLHQWLKSLQAESWYKKHNDVLNSLKEQKE